MGHRAPCEHENTMVVELNTPAGSVFSGHADGVELRTTDGVIAIQPGEESYLNLTQTTEITLRVGTEFLTFVLKNAAASLRDGQLTVVAEEVRLIPAAPVSAAP
jgi:F0F1-type ATP synthase epsilon subunit